MARIPAAEVWGIGPASARNLAGLGVKRRRMLLRSSIGARGSF
jgi:hypothetical protein